MATVKDILDCVQAFAPTYMKESWDKVGLNCGHLDAPVTKVMIALDPLRLFARKQRNWVPSFL